MLGVDAARFVTKVTAMPARFLAAQSLSLFIVIF